ncbi:hypothetical protein N4T57_04785 [Campylobacter hepaticus]|uniref:Ferrochelatase n=1 Tax=Campylobacter hepaticus TaxID=1813019 RepID=A0A424Z2U2_9BACT|nr:hypothetical protein [Campylobacter hepaticus]AXP08618.1 hypothetical protein A2J15_002615 [Campylobacter hepaticus]MCZ0772461.1 hypothetical protein [Campylobacter hepaticus]MCZ0773929.1 hypothetical protein [Campylobacter hepaticus]MCZ0775180.1 hypothetical protein [Campylobacter hepaticus]MDX2323317.1 hypothetical protein [Campylobacter hepaticus]
MHISNLGELLNATLIHKGSILSVEGFAINLNHIKKGFAFFNNDEKEIDKAIKKGAYAIITQNHININDKEIFYFKVENLEQALTRLLRFLCQNQECEFLLFKIYELSLCKAFSLNILQGNIFADFEKLVKAKKNDFFCYYDEDYLNKLCANPCYLKKNNFTLLSHSSLFFTSLICQNLYFKNLNLPFFYAHSFSKIIAFLKEKKQKINFDFSKIDDFKIYFINNQFEIIPFGTSSQAFIISNNEHTFNFWKEQLQNIKGFKYAVKNSLLCDFTYNNISDLKTIKDFKYCLIFENYDTFEQEFENKENQIPSLF